MARVRVAVPDEELSISAKAAKLLGQESPPSAAPKRKKIALSQIHFVKLVAGVCLAVIIILFAVLIQSRNSLQNKVNQLSNQPTAQGGQTNEITDIEIKISKFLLLPTNETPALATVNNVEEVKAKSPDFFKNAQNGDKVLLYTKAGEAILYRPSENKIIKVAPVNSSNQTTQP